MPETTSSQPTQVQQPQGLTSEEISNKVSSKVILIQTDSGHGSGFLVYGGNYALTNAHVVSGYTSVKITQGNDSYSGTVIGRDDEMDVALIDTHGRGNGMIPMGDSSLIGVGADVLAFGYPLYVSPTVTLTKGIISAKYSDYLQTDAPIHNGNSGGPLVNNKGEVVGINTMMLADKGVGGTGLGFAIPINLVKEIVDELKNGQITYSVNAPPPTGSTLDIAQSLIDRIVVNPDKTCDYLFSMINEELLCDLYRNSKNSYTWNILQGQ
jgi:serine protease Do